MRAWLRRGGLMLAAVLGLVPKVPAGSYDWHSEPPD
jgi:hypothetical protein